MNLLKQINRDKEIQELKKFIKENDRFVPGIYFWDGETIDEYRIRLRMMADEIKAKAKYSDRRL